MAALAKCIRRVSVSASRSVAMLASCTRVPLHGLPSGIAPIGPVPVRSAGYQQRRGHSMLRRFRDETKEQVVKDTRDASKQGRDKRSVIIALDASPEAAKSVDWAADNLLREGDAVHLVHMTGGHIGTPSTAQQLLDKYKARLDAGKVALHEHILTSPAGWAKHGIAEAICDQAAGLGAALVIVATHSHGGLSELIRGSVADYTTKHCQSPVAILHEEPPSSETMKTDEVFMPFRPVYQHTWGVTDSDVARHLVLAVDSSEDSLNTVRWVLGNLWRKDDQLDLVHVVPWIPPSIPMTGSDLLSTPVMMGPELMAKQEEQAENEARDWAQVKGQQLQGVLMKAGAKFQFHVSVVFTEDPVTSISTAVNSKAEELKAAAVVLSYHPRSALMQMLMGSVGSQVAHQCVRPVIVLHGTEQSPRDDAVKHVL